VNFDWRPSCDLQHLRMRAQMLAEIRVFFAARDVMEVETPLLSHTSGTDPQLDFFQTYYQTEPQPLTLYLQTSPEFAMKRLLAAGSGSIYQICKAFRNGESGRLHNPEFSMLEWYRVDFSLSALMTEIAELLRILLAPRYSVLAERRLSYRQLFLEMSGLDPLNFEIQAFRKHALATGFPEAVSLCGDQPLLWLDFIFSHSLMPRMTMGVLYLIYDYPAIQSSLARQSSEDCRVVKRFEAFMNGIELANGFHELADAKEQEQRFRNESELRQKTGRHAFNMDYRLLAALQSGLPDCSGVALGLDRLLMLVAAKTDIREVLSFPLSNA
jgi:elongation factor P--(R)-beta-lysine ligase